jgi:head-tail adaptor
MASKSFASKKGNNGKKHIDLRGEVRAADLDSHKFSLRLEDGTKVIVKFTSEQEHTITEALRGHVTQRLRLKGRAEVARTGRIKKLASVESLAVEPAETPKPTQRIKPIWEVALEIGASVSRDEWARVPTDGARNIHHYLYGGPKQEE